MGRISKSPEERKKEIISVSRKLFLEKGYAKTKVSDIVKAIGVSQGIFYYYYPSKEMIIDEIVDQYMTLHLNEARRVLEEDLSPLQKLEQMVKAQSMINQRENQSIHLIQGVDIHEKILQRMVCDYVPLMVEAFGVAKPEDAELKLEVFVAASNIIFDPGLFSWSKEERNQRIDFMIGFMEKNLGLPTKSLLFFRELMRYIE